MLRTTTGLPVDDFTVIHIPDLSPGIFVLHGGYWWEPGFSLGRLPGELEPYPFRVLALPVEDA